jgi:hypothetical protein
VALLRTLLRHFPIPLPKVSTLDQDAFDLVQADVISPDGIIRAIIQLGRARRLVVGDTCPAG